VLKYYVECPTKSYPNVKAIIVVGSSSLTTIKESGKKCSELELGYSRGRKLAGFPVHRFVMVFIIDVRSPGKKAFSEFSISSSSASSASTETPVIVFQSLGSSSSELMTLFLGGGGDEIAFVGVVASSIAWDLMEGESVTSSCTPKQLRDYHRRFLSNAYF
jgi:hypothetical protein